MQLKRRVTFALAAVVSLFVCAQGLLAYLSLEEQEDDLVDELVLTQARTLAERLGRGELRGPAGAAILESTPNSSVWLARSDGSVIPGPVPAHLADLADGPHRPRLAGRELHAVVTSTPEGRLYVEYDAEQNEAKVREFGLYLIGLAALCITIGVAVSWRVAAWVVGPLQRLTARLASWAPEEAPSGRRDADEEIRLLDAFERVQGRFEGAIAFEREYVANFGHEVRTPLAALRTDLEMLIQPADLPATARLRLHRAIAAVDEIGGALEAARTMAGRRVTQQREVDLRACVEDAWANVHAHEARPTTMLDNQVERQTIVLADRHALLTILRNLMRNAVEHAAAKHCRVRMTGRGLEVIDDGSGIAVEDLPNVFERFYRGRMVDTRDEASGSGTPAQRGIGLAIARQLADLNGWTLTAHAAPELDPALNSGTAFVLGIRRPA